MRAGVWKTAVIISFVVFLSCGQKDPVFVAPEIDYGSVFVDSEPGGALIFIDGASTLQVTPDTVHEVVTGQRTVTVLLEGYESDPDAETVEVMADSVVSVSFTLTSVGVASRVVLIEEFTNTSCIPCAEASPIIDGLLEELGGGQLLAIKYHTGFPGATDPFYLHNRSDNDARLDYYGVLGIPDVFVDGILGPPSLDSDRVRQDVETRLATPPAFSIESDYEITGGQYSVTATVLGLDDPGTGDYVIHFALVESGVHFDDPPGANGETDFEMIMRKMLPDADGETFAYSEDAMIFEREVALNPAWNTNNIETIVFIQSQGTREILQARSDHE